MPATRPLMPAQASPLWVLAAAIAWTITVSLAVFSPWFPTEALRALHQASDGWLHPTLVSAAVLGTGLFVLLLGPGRQRPADIGLRRGALPPGLAATAVLWLAMNASTLIAARADGLPLTLHPDWSQGGLVPGRLLAQLLGTALVEETVFRAWLWPQLALRLHRLVPRAGAWTVALLVSQGLFALLHVPMVLATAGPAALAGVLVNLFVVGLITALLYAATRNLFFVVGLHALGNAPTLLMEPHGPPPTLVMAGVAIVMAVGVVLARRHRGASGGLRMTVAKG
ncbi:MAG: CPBP family intramembrane glutamic endopeptidase [Lysobacteraceae bacterium]|nr:hypothetical protein [Xanthomonadaceae bacterium]